jgi:hypothetical protein
MAFNMKPGRLSFQKTGHGLPPALLQERKPGETADTNPVSGYKSKEEAQLAANKKVAELKKQSLSQKPLGGAEDKRTFNAEENYIIAAKEKVTKFVKPGTQEYDKWKAAVKANPKIEDKFKSQKGTVTASESAQGEDKPMPTTPPAITTTPKENPVTGKPSQTIYTIEGSRGYAGEANKGKIGYRGLVTLNEKRAQKEIDFTNKMNALNDKKYAQAKEGDAAARSLTGKALERRNKIAEERRQALTRPMPVIKTTEADKGTAVRAANAMNTANWESNIAKNKAEGIDRVVYQKKSENKKAMKKSPAKKMKSKAKTPAKMKKY